MCYEQIPTFANGCLYNCTKGLQAIAACLGMATDLNPSGFAVPKPKPMKNI